ncbi:MAG: hypothetical protein AAGJ18_02590, partial [Bacteroidota bacterium]
GDISRVYFDTLERPLVVVTCSDLVVEDVGLGVGLLRVIDNIDVQGKVTFWKNRNGIGGVDMNLQTSNSGTYSEQTDNSGDYTISGIPTGGNGTLIPEKTNSNITNGLDILDALFLKRYVVGINDVSSDYQRVAMEVSGDEDVNVIDALLIELVIVGTRTDFGNIPSWVFIPEAHQFPVPYTNNYFDYPTKLAIADIRTDIDEPFIGVKMGDVDGSASLNVLQNKRTEDRTHPKQRWQYTPNYLADGLLEVIISSDQVLNLAALQSQFTWSNADQLTLISVEGIGLNQLQYSPNLEQQVKLVWVNNTGLTKTFVPNADLFKLVFQVHEKIDLVTWELQVDSQGFTTMMVGENDELSSLNLQSKVAKKAAIEKSLRAIKNYPNPFWQSTTLQFALPKGEWVTFKVYDTFGKEVFSDKKWLTKGNNYWQIDAKDWGVGLFLGVLQTSESNEVIKLLVSEND